jgi:hypothetical protein
VIFSLVPKWKVAIKLLGQLQIESVFTLCESNIELHSYSQRMGNNIVLNLELGAADALNKKIKCV